MQFSAFRDRRTDEGISSPEPVSGHRDHSPSLTHRSAEVSAEPVVPSVAVPFTTNPAKGVEYVKNIPAPQLPRLLVDGDLLMKEKGLGAYAEREPRCLETLSQGWGMILGWLDALKPGEAPVITSEKLCQLHSVVAAHDAEFSPGEFVTPDQRYMIMPLSHSCYSDLPYFDAEGLSEAEDIYEQHIYQCSLSDEQVLKKAAFIFRYKDESIRAPLLLGKNVTAELFRHIENPEAVRAILLAHKQNRQEASYPNVQQFYSVMARHLSTRTTSCFGRFFSGDKEGRVLDKLTECLTQDFDHYIRKVSPPRSELKNLTENTLLRLNQELARCRNEDELIAVLCRYTTELQQLHPFKSANGRTFTLLLQFLLMAYGLPPAILKSPESFLCCGQKRLAGNLRSALEDTRAAIQWGHTPGFSLHGYATPAGDKAYDHVCGDLDRVIRGGESG
ncbi:hypothetical protein [Endozoicomonas lisbonensis]